MKTLSTLFLGSLLITASQTSLGSELKSTQTDQQSLNLTIYNGGRALIRDVRQIRPKDKTSQIAFGDVAEKIMPQTVAIKGLEVLEQNYDFDLLSPQALVKKNVGNSVRIARRSNETGETLEWIEGTILSTNGGIILRMDDGSLESLNSNKNYHMIFDQVPQNLRITPTLSLTLQQPITQPQQVEMTYLSTGLSWQSDYILQLHESEKSASLDSWITLNNQSGISYPNANLQLLAGDVNMQRKQPRYQVMADAMSMAARSKAEVSQEAIQGYHLYSVPHKTDIKNNQSKQIKLFSANHIEVKKQLFDRAYVNTHSIDAQTSKPDQLLQFSNKKPYLGMPIPKGIIRVYAKDQQGHNQFIGEDSIDHSAVNDEIEIKLGKAFDLTVKRQTTKVRKISKKQTRISREIHINNGSKKEQTLKLSEIMPSQKWSISNASWSHQRKSPSEAEFEVKIPAMTDITVIYDVLITYP